MREKIFSGILKKGIFPFKGNVFKTKEEKPEEISGEKSEEELKKYINNTFTFIEEKSEGINHDLFKKYFNFLTSLDLAKKLFETKDKKKNSNFCRKNEKQMEQFKR